MNMKNRKYPHLIISFILTMAMLLTGCQAPATPAKSNTLNFSDVTFSNYKIFESPMKSLRGMAASPDGTALYTGHIQLGTTGIRKIDVETGDILWAYHDAALASDQILYREYPKGIAVDDRGYVYAMISGNGLTGATLAILNDSDGTPVSETFVDFGVMDSGANGIAIRQDGDRFYAYFISNYGPNHIYCYDVTDPAAPVLNTSFGVDGVVSLARRTGAEAADANYLAIADNGDLYVTIKLANGSKADAVGRFSSDGKTFEKVIDCEEAYGIAIAKDHIFVSTYHGEASAVKVYRLSDYSLVATLADDVEGHSHYSQVVVCANRIYIADQSYQTGESSDDLGSRILVSGELLEK